MDDRELAQKIGITEDKLKRIIRGQEPLSLEFVHKCATALGVSIDQLLTILGGSSVTEIRERYGLSISEFSQVSGIDKEVISKIETDEMPLTTEIMTQISTAMEQLDTIMERLAELENLDWTGYIRRFFSTERKEFLDQAIQATDDDRIKELLQRPEVSELMVFPLDGCRHLLDYYISSNQPTQAALISIMALKGYHYVARYPKKLSEEQRRIALEFSYNQLDLCKKHEFPECEARCAYDLGIGAAEMEEWEESEKLLTRAGTIYEHIAVVEPVLYLPFLTEIYLYQSRVFSSRGKDSDARIAVDKAIYAHRIEGILASMVSQPISDDLRTQSLAEI